MPKRRHPRCEFKEINRKIRKLEENIRKKNKKRLRARVLSSSSSDSSSSCCDSSAQRIGLQDGDCELSSNAATPASDAESLNAVRSRPASPLLPIRVQLPAGSPCRPEASETVVPIAVPAEPVVDAAGETHDDHPPELDDEILKILGVDPTSTETYGKEIQKDLAVRLEHGATTGLSKDSRKKLLDTYLVPSNCKLIGAPILNPELKAAQSDLVIKRDKAIESKQKVMSAAISSLGQAISQVMSTKNKDTKLLEILMDTGRLMCDCQHSDSLTRRNYVISSIKKEMKDSLHNTKLDTSLFGENLPETLKTAKALSKSAAELKVNSAPKPSLNKKPIPSTGSKNWKNNLAWKPGPRTSTPSTKETSALTKPQRAGYSRPSQSQRHSRGRR